MGAVRQHAGQPVRTKVMLVEDSAVVRGMMRNWLEHLDGVAVVATAQNGQIAIDMVGAAAPDIIILDIEMPVMDGITALPQLLRAAPQAKIVMASTLTDRNAQISLKALQLGATDYIAKPSFARDGNSARDEFKVELLRKIKGLSGPAHQVQSTRSPAPDAGWMPIPAPGTHFSLRKLSATPPRILLFGSSTGGPAALTRVFEALRGKLSRFPVLVVQHMPATFTRLLAEKLSAAAEIEGAEAVANEPLLPGRLYVAPGGQHMRLQRVGADIRIALDGGPPINHSRPAVDPMFESAAQIFGPAVLSVVLTGMGSDGARGAVAIADRGGSVFVQDEASSVVWGMPGATAAMGAAAEILPLEQIGVRIASLIGARSSR
ncbi:MAG: chemotaxis-specific protein-glutamate methyltransferase CheB [Hyphomicrobiaceae bacterium]|nr:chemotaxis-specific protein-glutamate methyltransferase CheB [Hyphomicrobiaceae bacterium]MCC0024216.1 chemotaxis-specific protein-glutamate methyltransferase CheB [Hyphomicrobiaceae bacterium]